MNTRLTQYCVISHDAPAEKVVQIWGQVWIDDVVLNGLHYESFPTDILRSKCSDQKDER